MTDDDALARRFPADFTWGVATSAFQIEGAANEGGRGLSIWDTFCRRPGAIADRSNGDVACDHVHRLDEDLDLIAALGVKAYRFSVSWPRVQPLGEGPWSAAGVDFYARLVDGLRARGIAPWLTLNHWDLPQALQDRGGWAELETVARFVDYARGVAARYGDRVASITTHNEPWVIAVLGHEKGIFAPGLRRRALAFQVAHHLLLSHGQAVRAMRADGCRVPLGIVLNMAPAMPMTDSVADREQARLDDALGWRWYLEPLLVGRYPAEAIDAVGGDAPRIEPGDLETIAAPIDFLGINYYTRHMASASEPVDAAARGLPVTEMGWEIYPQGLTDLLLRLSHDYRVPPLVVTENGAAFADRLVDGEVHDPARIDYLRRHIEAVARAREAGAPVTGYFVWSLMDNFEWSSGYTKRFGIVHVDDATLRRTPKASARWLRSLMVGGRGAPAR